MPRNQRPPRLRPWLAPRPPVVVDPGPRTLGAAEPFVPPGQGPHSENCGCVKCVFGESHRLESVLVVDAVLDGRAVQLTLPVDELGLLRGVRRDAPIPRKD